MIVKAYILNVNQENRGVDLRLNRITSDSPKLVRVWKKKILLKTLGFTCRLSYTRNSGL